MKKEIGFSRHTISKLISEYGTPFYLYDEKGIKENANKLLNVFSWNKGFEEYFAVKAAPNPHILNLLKKTGLGFDCSSLTELMLSEKLGVTGDKIMFTSNNTSVEEFTLAKKINAIINLDDVSHVKYINGNIGLPDTICFRYNPGDLKNGNSIIGNPHESKFGVTKDQLFEGYQLASLLGVKHFGLHTMVASNELNPEYFIETAEILFNLAVEIFQELNIKIEFINLGGGIGIPYHPEENEIDVKNIGDGVKSLYDQIIAETPLHPLKLSMECGRYITGSHGYIVTKVRHLKQTYKNYAGLDISTNDLMRPVLYGSYHHITVLDKENDFPLLDYDLTGSLCENNDKLAVNRKLPELEVDDVIIIHDTGAHCHAMGNNYNGKLRSKEILLKENGEHKLIRRAETFDDHFATINFDEIED